jgi:lysophospholipase
MKSVQRILLMVFGLHLVPLMGFALPEAGLDQTFESLALPYFESGRAGVMVAKDKVRIHYRVFEASQTPAKGIIIVSTGRKEIMRKYAELAYDLRDSGYTIYLYDHRGQGQSSRLIKDPLKGYVGKFQDYVDDLKQLVREVVRPAKKEKIYLMAHSMGAAIATRFAIQNPTAVRAIVTSSPMYEAKTGEYSQPMALTLLIGKGQDYARGRGPNDWTEPFEKNEVTTSRARHAYNDRELRRNFTLALAGPTNRWVREAILTSYYLKGRMSNLKTPLLLLQPENEIVVNPEVQTELCKKTKYCKLVVLKGAKHEIFMERDQVRDEAFTRALDFFARY